MSEAEAASTFVEQSQSLIHLLWSALESLRSAQTPYRIERARADFSRLASEIAAISRSCSVDDCAELAGALERAMALAPETAEAQRALVESSVGAIPYLLRRKRVIEEARATPPPDEYERATVGELVSQLKTLAGDRPIVEPVIEPDPPALAPIPMASPTTAELDQIPATLRTSFLGEAQDLITKLQRIALEMERAPADGNLLAAAIRIAHQLRGSAGTVQMHALAQVAFEFEELLQAIRTGGTALGAWGVVATLQCIGLLQKALDQETGAQPVSQDLVAQAANLRASALVVRNEAARSTPEEGAQADASLEEEPDLAASERSPTEGEMTLKVDVRRLDDLMARVSALSFNRSSLAGARDEVTRLQEEMAHALGKLNALAERLQDLHPTTVPGATALTTTPFPYAAAPDLSLPTPDRAQQFDHSMRVMREAVDDVTTLDSSLRAVMAQLQRIVEAQETLMGEVQHDVIEMRLVPLDDIVLTLQLAARLLAADLGKSVLLSIRGEATQIDREISDSLKEPLLQLLRNAITHGIESAQERRAAGKPEEGRVWLHAHYVGNEVSIEIGDDGRGVNLEMLKEAAVKAGRLRRDAVRQLTLEQTLDLMFLPGVSTYGRADMVGGRGVGLDEVREALRRLKGTVSVSNNPGVGSVFRIRVPISLSITHVLHISAGGQGYAIPFSFVQRTMSLTEGQIRATGATSPAGESRFSAPYTITLPQALEEGGDQPGGDQRRAMVETPAYPLASLLGRPSLPEQAQVGLIVEHGHERVALLVDAAHEDRELVARSLAPHLRRKAIRGVTVTPDGQILLILDVAALLARATNMPMPTPPALPPPTPARPRILVVDDSASIRRVLVQDLAYAGFEVSAARDGIDALQAMVKDPPQVVILDIEMPRLDGFEFLSALRDSTQFAATRIIMLTSRAAEKHQDYARQLGADAYFVKPCPIATLIAKIHELLDSAPQKVAEPS
jgi:chemosensory pili system protein ChpA (sensor histidine kinase/response regulator)